MSVMSWYPHYFFQCNMSSFRYGKFVYVCVSTSRPLIRIWALTGRSVTGWSVTQISSGSAQTAASSQLCPWTVRRGLSMIWLWRLRMGPTTLAGPPLHSPSKCWTWMTTAQSSPSLPIMSHWQKTAQWAWSFSISV